MGYIYKNITGSSIVIGGYHFKAGEELESDVDITATLNGSHFADAISKGILIVNGSTTPTPPPAEEDDGEEDDGEEDEN